MMQRRRANAVLYTFLVAMPSARALISLAPMEGSFAHDGTSPQR